jgi:hypothetical protein
MFKIFKVSNFPAFLRLRWILLLFLAIFTASIIIVISPLLDKIPSRGVTIRRLLEMIVVPLIIGITSAFLIIFFGYNRLLKTLDQIEHDKESGELKKFWSSGKYTICYGKYGGLYVDLPNLPRALLVGIIGQVIVNSRSFHPDAHPTR